MTFPRVALFTDSYYEANGVARTANALEAHAASHDRPMLVVHGGPTDQMIEWGSTVRLELKRARVTSVSLEHDLLFDVALWRHARRVERMLEWFQPDLVHVTGPSDIGLLGAYLAHRAGLPIVGSWHTNLHEYASRRLMPYLRRLPRLSDARCHRLAQLAQRGSLWATLLFYKLSKVTLAPNAEWADVLRGRFRRQTFVMTRGVDTTLFSPDKRTRTDAALNIGYVGRLSAEKSVRTLASVAHALAAEGVPHVRFTIVGDGSEREWLRQNVPGAVFTGVLRGADLSAAYANMDLFVFPSETETVGNVVLEAMASGVPVVAMAQGGPKFIASASRGAVLAHSQQELVDLTVSLAAKPNVRRVMAAAAREDALSRSWSAVFETVYHAYESALAIAPGQARNPDGQVVAVVEGQA
jgi:glycosyltransferase involved in cell wall biosynthesis